MNILQCKICNKPFQSIGNKICGNCLQEIDEAFINIRDYLYDNPGNTTVEKLAKDTETSEVIVLHLIREGRLEIGTGRVGPSSILTCAICKQPIREGTMCATCKNTLSSTLSSSLPAPPPKTEKKKSDQYLKNAKWRIDRSTH